MALKKKIKETKKPLTARTSSPKTTRKVVSARKTATTITPTETVMSMPTAENGKRTIQKKNIGKVFLGLVILGIVLYLLRGWFVVEIINGQPIWRFTLDRQLEQQGGKQVLDNLKTQILVEQEATRQHITVSQKELDDAQKQIETSLASQGQSLDSALLARGMSKSDFTEQLRLQKLIEKLLAKDLVVTDKDIADYIANNQGQLPQGMSDAQASASAKQQIIQQRIQTDFPTYLASLEKKSKIIDVVTF